MKRKLIGALVGFVLVIGWITWWKITQTTPPIPVTLVAVVDGDTIDVDFHGNTARVRILGIDTPETGECGSAEATWALNELLAGKDHMRLVDDPFSDDTDRFGRILAYVDIDGIDVGKHQIENGMAAAWWPSSATPPLRGGAYLFAEHQARQDQVGSWGSCGNIGR